MIEGYTFYYSIEKWRHYLEHVEMVFEHDSKSLQKFLIEKTDNIELDRWS